MTATPLAGLHCTQSSTAAELEEIQRFRYRIYVEEFGKPLDTADHRKKALIDPLDGGALHFSCRKPGGELIGTARLHLAPPAAFPDRVSALLGIGPFLADHGSPVGFISNLMIDPDLRGSGAVLDLLSYIYRKGRNQGAVVCFSHCQPKWVPLYEKLGLHRFGRPFHDSATGAQVPMVQMLEDEAHYRNCGSPLLSECLAYENDAARVRELRNWFLIRMAWAGNETRQRTVSVVPSPLRAGS